MRDFDSNRNLATLDTRWVSLANSRQRRGRAGRVQAGEFLLSMYTRHTILPGIQFKCSHLALWYTIVPCVVYLIQWISITSIVLCSVYLFTCSVCCLGICYHLYTRYHENKLSDYQRPEMIRLRLENVCLDVKVSASSAVTTQYPLNSSTIIMLPHITCLNTSSTYDLSQLLWFVI